jgi:acetate---CoA ligase (ADP-forming)
MFRPASIAVVGASGTPGKAGNALLMSLRSFTGPVYPVHPRASSIEGLAAFGSVGAIGTPVDLAILAVPAGAVPGALEDCAAAGVAAAVICAGGFAETEAGRGLQDKVVAIARRSSLRLLGPNSSGFVNPVDSVVATFVRSAARLPAGDVAIVARSGGMNLAASFLAAEEGLGIRLGVGIGNGADVEAAEILDFLAADDRTAVIGLHLEGIADGRALCEAVRRASAVKPVVAYKVGRSDLGEFARSHTGALLGDFTLACAALRQSGAVVVGSLTELVDALAALRSRRASPRRAPGVGVVTGQAGPGLAIADVLGAAGVRVPALRPETTGQLERLLPPLTWVRNPVDTGRPAASFGAVLSAVAADPAVDILAVYALDEPEALVPAEVLPASGAPARLPVVFGTAGPADAVRDQARVLGRHGVQVYSAPGRAATAAAALAADSAAQWRLAADSAAQFRLAAAGPPAGQAALPALPADPDEDQVKQLLEAAGITTMQRRACRSRAAAAAALAALGGLAVVKVLHPGLAHKSDAGGVHLAVRDARGLQAALDAIDAIPVPGPARYLVEQQAPAGIELIIGGIRDPSFGPVLMLGLGGVDVELVAAPIVRMAPLTRIDAEEMVAALPAPVRRGHRGAPALPADAVAGVLLAVSGILAQAEGIVELEINPLRVTATAAIALDALAVTDRDPARQRAAAPAG